MGLYSRIELFIKCTYLICIAKMIGWLSDVINFLNEHFQNVYKGLYGEDYDEDEED